MDVTIAGYNERTKEAPSDGAGETLSRLEVEMALRRVLEDPEFLKNSNSAKFLKFVVAETLDGRGSRLKAYTIATLALEREASFDPGQDSIVRVQAMRLREGLELYYAGAGAGDPVRIVLRRGTYQPAFERRLAAEEAASEAIPAEPERTDRPRRHFTGRNMALVLGLAVATVAIAACGLWLSLAGESASVWPLALAGTSDGPPTFVVERPVTAGDSPSAARLASRLFGSIEEGLSRYEYISLRSAGFRNPSPTANGYVLNGQVLESENGRSDVSVRVVREPTGNVVWSRHYDDVDADDRSAVDKLANSIVWDLGDATSGVIFADIRQQLEAAKAPLRGYACLIGGVEFLKTRSAERRVAERKCLETEIRANPDNVGASTLLSTLLILSYLDASPESQGPDDLKVAAKLALRAYDLAPQRAPTLDALLVSRFYEKRFDDAFQTARQMLVANPNAALFAEAVATAEISRGSYEDGRALLQRSEATATGPPLGAISFLALAAYMRGDRDATLAYAEEAGAAATSLGLVMRILACHEHGDTRCVDAASARLRADFPGFARDVPAALDRYALIDAVKTKLLDGLASAGWTPVATVR